MEVAALAGLIWNILKKVPRVVTFWKSEKRADSMENRESIKVIWDGYEKRLELAESAGDVDEVAAVRREYAAHIETFQRERNWELREFEGFRPRAQETSTDEAPAEDDDSKRRQIYERQEGFFLIHSWRASHEEGQVADIVISIYHHPDGVIPPGRVKQVTYELGRRFFEEPVVMTNVEENFRLELSAYDSMLCLARMEFEDDMPPLELHRYVNFPKDELLSEIEWELEAYYESQGPRYGLALEIIRRSLGNPTFRNAYRM